MQKVEEEEGRILTFRKKAPPQSLVDALATLKSQRCCIK